MLWLNYNAPRGGTAAGIFLFVVKSEKLGENDSQFKSSTAMGDIDFSIRISHTNIKISHTHSKLCLDFSRLTPRPRREDSRETKRKAFHPGKAWFDHITSIYFVARRVMCSHDSQVTKFAIAIFVHPSFHDDESFWILQINLWTRQRHPTQSGWKGNNLINLESTI